MAMDRKMALKAAYEARPYGGLVELAGKAFDANKLVIACDALEANNLLMAEYLNTDPSIGPDEWIEAQIWRK